MLPLTLYVVCLTVAMSRFLGCGLVDGLLIRFDFGLSGLNVLFAKVVQWLLDSLLMLCLSLWFLLLVLNSCAYV